MAEAILVVDFTDHRPALFEDEESATLYASRPRFRKSAPLFYYYNCPRKDKGWIPVPREEWWGVLYSSSDEEMQSINSSPEPLRDITNFNI